MSTRRYAWRKTEPDRWQLTEKGVGPLPVWFIPAVGLGPSDPWAERLVDDLNTLERIRAEL